MAVIEHLVVSLFHQPSMALLHPPAWALFQRPTAVSHRSSTTVSQRPSATVVHHPPTVVLHQPTIGATPPHPVLFLAKFLAAVVALLWDSVSYMIGLRVTHRIFGMQGGDVLNLLGISLVTHIHVFISASTLFTSLVESSFEVHNPFLVPVTIDFAITDAGVDEKVYAHFEQPFARFTVPAFGTANSGNFPNVRLTQGALNSLLIVPRKELDLLNTDLQLRLGTLDSKFGIPVTLNGLKQRAVRTT
ncbi:hypothetical protein BV25DRAFT_1820588 [Artomyces pyxidatus]|uniref:Uncharacterized protein n=1 Tax=Artomyces pyxidatus TaxID=48021 RepID=A0ACB8TDS7_9AGAM|nr:hypothetical protein BV25DRAFT_1820588 [Artomyces pyxidatus]